MSSELAAKLAPVVPDVRAAMPLESAMELVFSLQEELFLVRVPDLDDGDRRPLITGLFPGRRGRSWQAPTGGQSPEAEPLSKAAAQDLTARIRAGLGELPQLLFEAHSGRAWQPLGYRSWEQYVRREFRLSRSRSYELLDQACVVAALRSALQGRTLPPISTLASLQIKPLLGDVVEDIRHHLEEHGDDETDAEVEAFVLDTVRNARARTRAERSAARAVALEQPAAVDEAWFDDLCAAIELFTRLAAPADIVLSLDAEQLERMPDVAPAARWLAEFSSLIAPAAVQGGWEVSGIPDTPRGREPVVALATERRIEELLAAAGKR